jgi:hypothetical protein
MLAVGNGRAKRFFALGATILMSLLAFSLSPATSASAAPVVVAASGQPAPVCIQGKLSIEDGGLFWDYHLRVENHCTGTFTVKAVIVHHSDSHCYTLARGQYFSFNWSAVGNTAPLEGIVLC